MSLWLGCWWSCCLSLLIRPWSLVCAHWFLQSKNLLYVTRFFLHRLHILWKFFVCFILSNGERQNICQSFFPLTDSISLIELCFFFFIFFLLLQLEVLCRVLFASHIRSAHVSNLAGCGCAHLEIFFFSFLANVCKKFYNNIWVRDFTNSIWHASFSRERNSTNSHIYSERYAYFFW